MALEPAFNKPAAGRQGGNMTGALQPHGGHYLLKGVLLVVAGILAIMVPMVAALAIELIIGWLFLISGIIQGVLSFQKFRVPGFWSTFISAILAIIIGVMLVAKPLHGMVALTVLLAAFFAIEGIIEIIMGLELRSFKNWGWFIASGVIAIVLSVIIFSGLPGTASWAIGTLVGINMLFGGFALISLSSASAKV